MSFYRNIFLSKYLEQKSLVCNGPKNDVKNFVSFYFDGVLWVRAISIFKYSARRLIGSLWAETKVITLTEWFN